MLGRVPAESRELGESARGKAQTQEGKHRLRCVLVSLQVEGCHKGLSGKPVRTGKRDGPWVLCSRPWPVSQCTEKILAVVLSREPGMTWMNVPDPVALIAASFCLPPGKEDQELKLLFQGSVGGAPSKGTLGN